MMSLVSDTGFRLVVRACLALALSVLPASAQSPDPIKDRRDRRGIVGGRRKSRSGFVTPI